ncbi:hypothetical protein M0638_13740 [Roseomonas sp. NAR14]|uniref:Uncharacterized protein n=1 Tax=Roseomonas acroporae TaxID=2937791 RepID=A0A9X1YB65_9PROT|nr:hypothetical protein [Roseomonas acroporae]MCK8785447.1 hypothetical protein [Roseomonas acroporae]
MAGDRSEADGAAASPAPLPDPRGFDPVRFPGQGREAWPPRRFDFTLPWLGAHLLRFERDAAGGICAVRRCEHLRLVVDFEAAHLALDVPVGSRDFRLLRLVPAALRFTETVAAGDPVPRVLTLDESLPPNGRHLRDATLLLLDAVAALGDRMGPQARALGEALRRLPPGAGLMERALAARFMRGDLDIDLVGPLARRVQRLAEANARVMAAVATQPDYRAMERMLVTTRDAMRDSRHRPDGLLLRALDTLAGSIDRPRRAAEALRQRAVTALREAAAGGALQAGPGRHRSAGADDDFGSLLAEQETLRGRLLELASFWQRVAAAWLAVDPETTERREVEALARNAILRLQLHALYRPPEGPAAG